MLKTKSLRVGDKVKLDEVLDLIDKVFECSLEEKNIKLFISVPNPEVYDSEAEGYKLLIKDISESTLNCIKSIVQKHKLKYLWTTHKSEKVLVIYTPRKD